MPEDQTTIRQAALHQKSGYYTSNGSFILNKTPPLVVDCNFGAKPRQAEHITQRARLGFEQAKHLATLNTASVLLISGFLRIIFPRPIEEDLWISVGSKVLIAGSFVLFGLSLVLSAFAMYAFFQKLDEENPHHIKAQYQTRIGIPFVCFFLGLFWFAIAVLINFL